MTRIVVLTRPGDTSVTQRTRHYPLPDFVEPRASYLINGDLWITTAVLTSEDVEVPTQEVTK